MDLWSILIAAALGLGLGWIMIRNNNTDFTRIHMLERNEFMDNMRKGQLVDIRKKEAFETDKIKGARHIKSSEIGTKYSKLRHDQSVYIYCQNGRKSKRNARKLARNNYPDIYVLVGGMDAYNTPS